MAEPVTQSMNEAAVRHAALAFDARRSLQTLMGIIGGIVADGRLHDLELQFLSTWLSHHPESLDSWPGSAIVSWVRAAMADGVIDEDERALILANLQRLLGTEFEATGSAAPEPTRLPVDDTQPIEPIGSIIVHTGTFLFGTRSRCERLSEAMGGTPASNITKSVNLVVIGSMVTSSWVTESFGRKILAAVELQRKGHPLRIVSEAHWLNHAKQQGLA